jgi:putative DNA primase/helicase
MANKKELNMVINQIIDELPSEEPKYNDDNKRIYLNSLSLAIYILQKQPHKIIASNGRLWIYIKGVYLAINSREKTLNFVMRCINKINNEEFTASKIVDNVVKELFMQYYELVPYEDENITYINMKDNVLAVHKDGKIETLPHSKKYNFTYKLSYNYDENASSEVFNKFLKTSLGDEDLIKVIAEYLGYILNTNAKKYEKSLFFYGDGSNGKSTLINIIKAMFGVENISVVELTEMGDMLKCALMDSKLINISSDSKKNGLDTSAFKKIVTGEPVLGKYLFKDIYTIEKLPKLIIATNKLPYNSGDNSFGLYRRLLLVPFTKIITEDEKDYDLESKVITNELPAILNFAIQGMLRLNKQEKFTEAKAMKEALNIYKESSNHVKTFIDEEQYEVVESSSKQGTSLIKLYEDFKNWCSKLGYNPYNATYLSSELTHLGFEAYKNSSKHFRIVKKKIKNTTGFSEDLQTENKNYPYSD